MFVCYALVIGAGAVVIVIIIIKSIYTRRIESKKSLGAAALYVDRQVLDLPIDGGVKGGVNLGGWLYMVGGYICRWFTYRQTLTHPSSNVLVAT